MKDSNSIKDETIQWFFVRGRVIYGYDMATTGRREEVEV